MIFRMYLTNGLHGLLALLAPILYASDQGRTQAVQWVLMDKK